MQEPVAFLGGIFAGFLGLSLDQDPLKDWIEQIAAGSEVSATDHANACSVAPVQA